MRVSHLVDAFQSSIEGVANPSQAIWEFASLINTMLGYEYGTTSYPTYTRIVNTQLAATKLVQVVEDGMVSYKEGYGLVKPHLLLAIIHVPFHFLDPRFIKDVFKFLDGEESPAKWFQYWMRDAEKYLARFDAYAEAIIAERAAELAEANAALIEAIDEDNLPELHDDYYPEEEDWYSELNAGYYADLGIDTRMDYSRYGD
jgi:hypothetical protein